MTLPRPGDAPHGRSARAYARLLALLPRRFRGEPEAEMLAAFEQAWVEARSRGRLAVAGLWALSLWDLLLTLAHRRAPALTSRRPSSPGDWNVLDTTLKDTRYGLRTLMRAPGFTLTVVLTVALGIGANTAIFSVVNGVLLQPLPFPDPDRLVAVWADYTRRDGPLQEWLSYPNFWDLRTQQDTLEELALYVGWAPTITGSGEPEQLVGAQVTDGMFDRVLGVQPLLGRGFSTADDQPDAAPVVLLGHALWNRAFGGDPEVLGSTVSLDGMPHTIIGVMPASLQPPFLPTAEIWTTFRMSPTSFVGGRGSARFRAVGRLRPGADVEAAQAAATTLATRLEAEFPNANAGVGYYVTPLHDDIVGPTREPLGILLGAVGFVLLMACVNVANLLLVRASARTSEIAVRSALGAKRSRIVRQLLSESLLLAGLGGIVGVVLGVAGTRALVSLAPAGTPRIEEVAVSGTVLAFAAGLTVLSAVIFGLLPALRAARTELTDALREGGRGQDGSARGHMLRSGLVVFQVALALVLLVGAGLMVRTFQSLNRVELGFDPEGVLALNVALPSARYADGNEQAAFYKRLEERLATLPGVESVGLINSLPLGGFNGDTGFHIEGREVPPPGQGRIGWVRRATPGYLETLRIPVVRGRGFLPSDDAQAPRVVMINETLAQRYFADEDPIGQRIGFGNPDTATWREIVGVVHDVKNFGVATGSRNAIYFPYEQVPTGFMFVAVRAAGDPLELAPTVRREIAQLDPNLAAAGITTMEQLVSGSLATERFLTTLLTAFAGVALGLAAIGLYGVVSYGVALRSREMGIRIALGAEATDIGRSVIGGSLVLTAVGIVAGVAGAFSLTRLMESLLFGVEPRDPSTFVIVVAAMLLATLVAAALPARRAGRVDPIAVLNRE